jgi:hypothetical protein
MLFGRFPNFSRLSIWYKKNVDEDEYAVLVESCWEGKTNVLGENPLPVHFAHHKSHMELSGFEPGPPAVTGQRLNAWAIHYTAWKHCSNMNYV